MQSNDLRAELSMKMLELEQALDLGMPYKKLKSIYSELKLLQYKITLADSERNMATSEDSEIVLE